MADTKKLKPYEPTKKDMEFFRMLIRNVNERGIWCIPRTGQSYVILPGRGTFTLVSPDWDASPEVMFHHHHNHYILKKLGWKCLPEINWEDL